MNKSSNDYSSGGIGFFGLLTIVFITLKLIGAIDWSWIWVLSPLWCPIVLVIAILIIAILIAGFVTAFSKDKNDEDDDDEEI